MKSITAHIKSFRFYLIPLIYLLSSPDSFGQLNNGGVHARFGVDADTKAGYLKYGPVTGIVATDDWFGASTGLSIGVIDTSNTAFYRNRLQSNNNISFVKRMAYPLYSKLNGTILMEAIYARDYICQRTGNAAEYSNDSTTFSIICKNGDDPANWRGGTDSTTPPKNDLIDTYAHLRRNGTYAKDSLWFYTGVSLLGTTGSRHFDVELFKNIVTYTSSSGLFTTGGPSAGHAEWKFDEMGNIIETGDLIISVSYSAGSAPVIDVRIWISKATYLTTIPALFNFGANFDGKDPAALTGYANIVSKTSTTAFGSGIANFSATPANDTTYATPWGSRSYNAGTGLSYWNSNYNSLQHIEIGINMTRIGIDPALYAALGSSACDATFQSIFFKSRSSNAFTANLQDFVGTFIFQQPALNHTVQGDTLSCNQPTGTFTVTSNTTAGYYTWTALNGGNITSSNSDSTIVTINRTGTYILNATAANGCTVVRRDTLTIIADSLQPVATADFTYGSGPYEMQLLGGDPVASNANTPFGNSQGLSWNWSGPNSFSSTLQNPYVTMPDGTYQVICTEQRNGCRDTATIFMNFALLQSANFRLKARETQFGTYLSWLALSMDIHMYVIERKSNASGSYKVIGSVTAGVHHFNDDNINGTQSFTYRIKALSKTGGIYYSNEISVKTMRNEGHPKMIYNPASGILSIEGNINLNETYQIGFFHTNGQLLFRKTLDKGRWANEVALEKISVRSGQILLVALYQKENIMTEKIYIK